MPEDYPIGPGFFIFFQDAIVGGPGDGSETLSKRIMQDDNEMLEIITMMVNGGII